MKFGIFVHRKRPKVSYKDILKVLHNAGVSYSKNEPDVAVVIGGDGTFGYYGRTLSIPLLFVGVKDTNILGSKSRLAEIFYDDLGTALRNIEAGKYHVEEEYMLSVSYKGRKHDVLTDVYLERGIFAGCLRYTVSVQNSQSKNKSHVRFTDHAIGNGVIVSTSFGSAGYYFYPDRIRMGDWYDRKINRFAKDRIGICHVVPSFVVRERNDKRYLVRRIHYTVPSKSLIKIGLARKVDARLYGTTDSSKGIGIDVGDVVIRQSERKARIIRLRR